MDTAKKVFADDYLKKNTASSEFVDFINHGLECEYTSLLLFTLHHSVTDYPDNYMDGKIVGDYNSTTFVVASDLYIRWYREIEKYGLTQMIGFINSKFKGDTRDYLLSVVFGKYSDGENVDGGEYLQLAEKYEKDFRNENYVNYIKGACSYFSKSLSVLPDSIMVNTKLKSLNLEETNLKAVLEKIKGKYLILEFWASWCGPCIADIEQSGEMKALLASNDVVYVYLSLDRKSDSWKAASERLGINDNQYLLLDIEDSPLINYFKIVGIPRYIYLNKDFSVINLNGRSPIEKNKEYLKKIFDL